MRVKRSLVLLGPGLLTSLALSPALAGQAAAAPAPAAAAVAARAPDYVGQPPDPTVPDRNKAYWRGHAAGYEDGAFYRKYAPGTGLGEDYEKGYDVGFKRGDQEGLPVNAIMDLSMRPAYELKAQKLAREEQEKAKRASEMEREAWKNMTARWPNEGMQTKPQAKPATPAGPEVGPREGSVMGPLPRYPGEPQSDPYAEPVHSPASPKVGKPPDSTQLGPTEGLIPTHPEPVTSKAPPLLDSPEATTTTHSSGPEASPAGHEPAGHEDTVQELAPLNEEPAGLEP